jgi:prepilin-type N-terminal cleavage/methylation domain-containing protein
MRAARAAGAPRRLPRGARAGFTLVEVMIAMAILTTALLAIAYLALSASRSAANVSGSGRRGAELLDQMNRLSTVPYDSVRPESVTVSAGPYRYTRVVRVVTNATLRRKQVTLIVRPRNVVVRADSVRTDSVTLFRTDPPTDNPLCTGC